MQIAQHLIRIIGRKIRCRTVDDKKPAVLRNRVVLQKIQILILAVQLRKYGGKIAPEALFPVPGQQIDLWQTLTDHIGNRGVHLPLCVISCHALLICGIIDGIFIQIRIVQGLMPRSALHDQ